MEIDIDFIVRTHREGNLNTDDKIEGILNKMGGQAFNDRFLGGVAAVVEKRGGIIDRAVLRWSGDAAFKKAQQTNADALLEAVRAVVEAGGGDDDHLKVKIVAKM